MMTEAKGLEQSNTDSTGIQSDIKAQQVYQADTIHVYSGNTSSTNQDKPASKNSTNPTEEKEAYAVFSIEGSIKDPVQLAKLKALVKSLQKITGDTSLEIEYVEEGSIKVTLKGSLEAIEKLKELFDEGQLKEEKNVSVSIKNIEILNTEITQKEKNETNQLKSLLVSAIKKESGHRLNLSQVDLSQATLSQVDLSQVDLSYATLINATLSQANLSYATLINATLSQANLSYATLINATLSQATLINADLSSATLSFANLVNADLRHVDLINATLVNADLRHADLRYANLRHASLRHANLNSADLRHASLKHADLINATLINTNLSDTNVENAKFTDTKGLSELQKADLKFRGAIFEDSPGDRSEVSAPVRR